MHDFLAAHLIHVLCILMMAMTFVMGIMTGRGGNAS